MLLNSGLLFGLPPQSRAYLARALQRLGRYREADEMLARAAAHTPTSATDRAPSD